MSRADHARRGNESRRLTCLPRRPGEAASPSRFHTSRLPGFLVRSAVRLPGPAADLWLRAFAASAVAQPSVTLTNFTRLASDGIFAGFKIDSAQALTAGSHSHACKSSSVDAGMQDRIDTTVDTVSIHSNSCGSRPGNTILGTLTNPSTVFRKCDGFPGAVAGWSNGNRSHCRPRSNRPWSQSFSLRDAHVQRRRHRHAESGLRTFERRRAGGPRRLTAAPGGGWRLRLRGQVRGDPDGVRERRSGGLTWSTIFRRRISRPSCLRPKTEELPRRVPVLEGSP